MKLDVNGLTFSYGSKKALDDIGFTCAKGEIVGILGQNGCGKTTLLKCINQTLKPQGSVLVEDMPDGVLDESSNSRNPDGTVDVSKMTPREMARGMAVVSQSAFMTFPYTAMDAVMMGRYARSGAGSSKKEDMEVAFQALKDAGALEFSKRSVMELSGGELRRVMIARALCQQPEILLLDEPTLHLDVNHQFDLMDLIEDLVHKKDMLSVIVTHDMVLAARYCTKIILMEHGRIVDAGPTEEVMTEVNMREVFDMETEIGKDPRIPGLSVVLIGKAHRL